MYGPTRLSERHILEAHEVRYMGEVLHTRNVKLTNAIFNCRAEIFLNSIHDTHYFIIRFQYVSGGSLPPDRITHEIGT